MIVILVGVSGSGKDTIKKELLKKYNEFGTLPSITTRLKRVNEIEGENYYYISKKEFEKRIDDNEFYEFSYHHNNYYGTSKKTLDEKLKEYKAIIKDVDVNGAKALVDILSKRTKVLTIFLNIDKEEMKRRLLNREDNLSREEIYLRAERFDYEVSKIYQFDYMIKNNNLEKTLEIIEKIIDEEIKCL